MKINSIIEETTVDGPGLRTSIYTQGCPIKCKNCQNKQAQDISKGEEVSIPSIINLLKKDEFIDGISILGGEPFFQPEDLFKLVYSVKLELPHLSIWLYSGYTLEQLKTKPLNREILKMVDVLVDGPYIDSERDVSLLFRGSRNQRIIEKPYEKI